MVVGLSLANKCHLLFGAAVIAIVAMTLVVPWILMASLTHQSEWDNARQHTELWSTVLSEEIVTAEDAAAALSADDLRGLSPGMTLPFKMRSFSAENLEHIAESDTFAGGAARRFRDDPKAMEHHEMVRVGSHHVYRFAKSIRDEDGKLVRAVVTEHVAPRAASRLFVNRLYLLSAGMFAGGLAILVFYLITTRLILAPVRELRWTAERIGRGAVGVRSDIETGDEFEQLGESFNQMLEKLETTQDQLKGINRSLDLKVTQLEESNLELHEAAQLKGEFLANMSHELRTPLNSIIGFAELLSAIADDEAPGGSDEELAAQYRKRTRYLENIVSAGRSLLEMITDLLEMAKLEAGKVELHIEDMNLGAACDGLMALIRPQAEKKKIKLLLDAHSSALDATESNDDSTDRGLWIETDPRKFQQIVFNFLSNAVKFTPEGGRVTLRAERLYSGIGSPSVRVSVLDTGPGITAENQERIFEKFTQVESGHTREHEGTGLGLAICKELAGMIQGDIQLVSDAGRGSMFSLIVPVKLDRARLERLSHRLEGMSGPVPAEQDVQAIDEPTLSEGN